MTSTWSLSFKRRTIITGYPAVAWFSIWDEKEITIKKSYKTFLEFYDKRTFANDVKTNVYVAREGIELLNPNADIPAIWNDNIIGNLGAPAFALDVKNKYLVRGSYYHHGCVFILRNDNYQDKLPLWVAKMFPQDNWYEKDVYNTTSDGGNRYTKDNEFLKECLIYTCLSNQNKCLSFLGSDGREYQNELCFDNSRAEIPLAYQDLQKFSLNEDEEELMALWYKIMEEARTTENYDPHWNYGVYQITKELDTYHEEGSGRTKKKVYDYPTLHGNLDSLRTLLKAYYKKHITPKMFEYELLK